jgi:hypothetical protein
VEGVHFVAGPWFTVQQAGGDWFTLDRVWLSNGKDDRGGQVQIRLRLAPPAARAAGQGALAAHIAAQTGKEAR